MSNDVGGVKKQTKVFDGGDGVKGAVCWRLSQTLDAGTATPIIEAATKRSARQRSFVA